VAAPIRPHRRPKLNEAQVEQIRVNRYGKTAKQLAEQHGVHYRTIEKIRAYETWAHV
jgi:DNA-binding CsgD family transcriptional regulator